ncbi:YjgF/chorismate_mutase-like, putative endoribonuclease [Antarctobacter heliothermus]|uniref:YjgF/chorismate_mutase-like, putative endoribonuclease n=1 Tax=Antarctobacter heliothermus TaxID=74033 RepID=A0A222E261_9RHOB|nr:RidA family protein [Antarctobacter heliothermus]ASP20068.1 YjgF/chorismate_mutase-like, putative endoribonuclease [Antarctobacter heliothermus]
MSQSNVLPEPIGTEYQYLMAARHGRVLLLASQIPKTDPRTIFAAGRCGEDIDMVTACESARLAAGQVLAWLEAERLPDETVDRVLRLQVYVAVAEGGFDISSVADAASETIIARLGPSGRHPRTVLGVSRLPRNAPVMLEATIAMSAVPGVT